MLILLIIIYFMILVLSIYVGRTSKDIIERLEYIEDLLEKNKEERND